MNRPPVEWQEAVHYFDEDDCQIEVHSGYLRLNPDYHFTINVPKFDLLLIGFVQVICHPREKK